MRWNFPFQPSDVERAPRGRENGASGSCATWTSEARPKAENGKVRVKRRLGDFIGRHFARRPGRCQPLSVLRSANGRIRRGELQLSAFQLSLFPH
jgi:hypothetical protein